MKSNNSYLCAFFVFIFTFIFYGTSIANDSTSYPSSTGIEFIKNDDISIEKENLFLAAQSVNVEYEFYNHSSKEIIVHMAFPLPTPDNSGTNPETWNFTVYFNDKKYNNVKVQWRALVNDIDKASILNKYGIPVNYASIPRVEYQDKRGFTYSASCLNPSMNQEDQELLIKEGLIIRVLDPNNCLSPNWIPQAVFLWEAKFPPEKMTKVKHSYHQPPGFWTCEYNKSKMEDYNCSVFGEKNVNNIKKIGEGPVDLYFYNYVIHTGGNWKGPIKNFNFKAQGPAGSRAWVEAPFPVKRKSKNLLSAHIDNYKPLSKSEYMEVVEKQRQEPLLRVEEGEIRFFYATKHKKNWKEQQIKNR